MTTDIATGAATGPANDPTGTPGRSEERTLFQGDVTLIRKLGVQQGHAQVTTQRLILQAGGKKVTLNRSELVSVNEAKHGWATKMQIQRASGEPLSLQAANARGLKNALLVLVGQMAEAEALARPEPSSVKNTTAWVAALGPLWADIITGALAIMMGWSQAELSTADLFRIVVFKLGLIYLFLRIDHLWLQKQGFDTQALGVCPPERFWQYLFSRAKAFGQGKAYAITWAVLCVLEIFWLLSSWQG